MLIYRVEVDKTNKPKQRHLCDGHKEVNKVADELIIAFGGLYDNEKRNWIEKGWVLDANTGNSACGAIVPIKFCPFCREELK